MSRTKDRTYLRNRARIRHIDVCALCGKWIDPELKSPHPMSWTADHIDPVARTRNNHSELQPAHRQCNSRKGARQHTPPARHGRNW